jgi:hypothetical protein
METHTRHCHRPRRCLVTGCAVPSLRSARVFAKPFGGSWRPPPDPSKIRSVTKGGPKSREASGRRASTALIDRLKIAHYLLSESHPVGRFKSNFFTAFGYSAGAWEVLAADLQRHAAENEAVATEKSRYGQKYEVRGSLRTTSGRTVALVTVWIILDGEDVPRFVTAYPERRI